MVNGLRRCPNCGKQNTATASVCDNCRLQLEGGPKAEWTSFMPVLKGLGVLAVVGLVLLTWKLWPLPLAPEVLLKNWTAEPVAEGSPPPPVVDPCTGRARCLVVYLAPWSSESKERAKKTIPEFRLVWRKPDLPGIKVIVGEGDAALQDELARLVGEPVFIDSRGEFKKRMKIDQVPAFFVFGEGRVLKSGSAALAWAEGVVKAPAY